MDVDVVKKKVISDFQFFLQRLEVGYIEDYQHILSEIAFIESSDYYNNKQQIIEFLIHNG